MNVGSLTPSTTTIATTTTTTPTTIPTTIPTATPTTASTPVSSFNLIGACKIKNTHDRPETLGESPPTPPDLDPSKARINSSRGK